MHGENPKFIPSNDKHQPFPSIDVLQQC